MTVGGLGAVIAEGAMERGLTDAFAFDSNAAAAEYLKGRLQSGDAVLFKASRSMKFEEIIEAVGKISE